MQLRTHPSRIWLHACPCEFFKSLFKVVVEVAVVVSAMATFLLIDVQRKLYHLSISQSDLKDVSLFIMDCMKFNLPLCFCQHPFAAEFVSDMVLNRSYVQSWQRPNELLRMLM
uniref:Uncharacterized protein n=1 Tax=Salix viminalis TaxID=40686 RepID=A0A6N2JYG0_SALVM